MITFIKPSFQSHRNTLFSLRSLVICFFRYTLINHSAAVPIWAATFGTPRLLEVNSLEDALDPLRNRFLHSFDNIDPKGISKGLVKENEFCSEKVSEMFCDIGLRPSATESSKLFAPTKSFQIYFRHTFSSVKNSGGKTFFRNLTSLKLFITSLETENDFSKNPMQLMPSEKESKFLSMKLCHSTK